MSDFKYSLTNLKPAEPVNKVHITFPDGATREFPKGTTGLDIAKGIGKLVDAVLSRVATA